MATQTPIIILVKMMITIIIFEWFYIIFPIQNSEEPEWFYTAHISISAENTGD